MTQSHESRRQSRLRAAARFALLVFFTSLAGAQTLDMHDAVKTFAALSNTTVTMSGRAELRITGTGDPLAGSVVNLNSPDAWLLLVNLAPSQVASTFLSRVRVNGASAATSLGVKS